MSYFLRRVLPCSKLLLLVNNTLRKIKDRSTLRQTNYFIAFHQNLIHQGFIVRSDKTLQLTESKKHYHKGVLTVFDIVFVRTYQQILFCVHLKHLESHLSSYFSFILQ